MSRGEVWGAALGRAAVVAIVAALAVRWAILEAKARRARRRSDIYRGKRP